MNQDEEMDRLVAAFIDGTLDENDRRDFETRVRSHPEAMERVIEAVRFEVLLHEATKPDQLERIQQRRTVIDRATGQTIFVESSDRMGRAGSLDEPPSNPPRAIIRWGLAALVVGVLSGWALYQWKIHQTRVGVPIAPSPLVTWSRLPLKNPGFENPDLGLSTTTSPVLTDWQEKFTTPAAVIETGMANGAHGGKQVARLSPGGHIKQSLYDAGGLPLTFTPGRRIKVSGWLAPTSPLGGKIDGLNIGLHFVDDQLRQYVVDYRMVVIDGSGWRHFTASFEVPAQELFEPSYLQAQSAPSASVTGRPILLSITNATAHVSNKSTFYLDDLEVEMAGDHGSNETR